MLHQISARGSDIWNTYMGQGNTGLHLFVVKIVHIQGVTGGSIENS